MRETGLSDEVTFEQIPKRIKEIVWRPKSPGSQRRAPVQSMLEEKAGDVSGASG